MHRQPLHQGDSGGQAPLIWLVCGTGDGPPLAKALLERGWRLRVNVVTAAAARAYPPHPRLDLAVGDLTSDGQLLEQLQHCRPRWLVDATHPFAQRITARLERVCGQAQLPLLRLERQLPEASPPTPPLRRRDLTELAQLSQLDLWGERLMLAIGSRQLGEALAHSNASAHFARVLDRPGSLQLALAAGLADHQLACLKPGGEQPSAGLEPAAIEMALCRRWRISSVLCRQSGGRSEDLWRQTCQRLDLQLLLLERPTPGPDGLPLAPLLEKLGHP